MAIEHFSLVKPWKSRKYKDIIELRQGQLVKKHACKAYFMKSTSPDGNIAVGCPLHKTLICAVVHSVIHSVCFQALLTRVAKMGQGAVELLRCGLVSQLMECQVFDMIPDSDAHRSACRGGATSKYIFI